MSDISVIIPVKNRSALLRKTLDNLLAQSKKPDEIIVIDDHSTDDFKLVIFDYITDCIFLNNKGHGPGAARNLGLTVATGKYIQFFDSDDLLTHRKLEHQFRALEQSGAEMAYGPYVACEELDGQWIQRDGIMQAGPLPDSHSLREWMLRGWNSLTQACLFRKTLIDKLQPWDEQLITYEDYLYLFRLSLENPTLTHVPDEGVIYRQHGAQSTDSQTKSISRSQDKMEVLVQMKELLPNSASDWLSSGLFRGRLIQNYSFYKASGGDPRRYAGFVDFQDHFWKLIYRLYNKQMRVKTGTAWEPMHACDFQKDAFNRMIQSIRYE
ncbi:MAG TPA: glycosyltransferase family 2 protein [Catalimonadaceae bacterium]|nr:glycosyltransferase family 2 protein [Catalimonadaceae bacterium]